MLNHAIQTICIYAIPLIFAITLHEAAHGWVAMKFGDKTAYMLGRVTLNPIPHIDPIGTIAIPGALILMSAMTGGSGLLFGWAKPVPVNQWALRNPTKDMLWVSLAGPASNLLQAIVWALILKVLFLFGIHERFLLSVASAGITVNLVLMAFNLIPILPLDGGRVLRALVPRNIGNMMDRMEPYGMMIVIVLMASGLLWYIASPILSVGEMIVNSLL